MSSVTLTSPLVPNPVLAGRVDVTVRALQRTVRAIAAAELDVPVRDVSVTLTDDRGRLGIAVTAPIRVGPLAELATSGFRLLDRGEVARTQIRFETERLAGRDVGAVVVRFSRAIVSMPRRVS